MSSSSASASTSRFAMVLLELFVDLGDVFFADDNDTEELFLLVKGPTFDEL